MEDGVSRLLPGLEDGLFGQLRASAATEWEAYVGHPFVRGLGDGTLAPERFRHFLVQDYLYLLQYARASALAITKADTLAEMRAAAQTVSGLLVGELSLHVEYCGRWGLDEAALQAQPASIETLAYAGFVLDRAQSGDLLDLVSVLSACLVGYAEVGARLASDPRTRREGNPYLSWIETYSGPTYMGLARDGIARLNALGGTRGGEARFPMLLRDFRTAVRLETAFWGGAMAVGSGPV